MKILIVIGLALIILFLYSACVISSRCSRIEERMEEENERD